MPKSERPLEADKHHTGNGPTGMVVNTQEVVSMNRKSAVMAGIAIIVAVFIALAVFLFVLSRLPLQVRAFHHLGLDRLLFFLFLRLHLPLHQRRYPSSEGLCLNCLLLIPARGTLVERSGRRPLDSGLRHTRHLLRHPVRLLLVPVVGRVDRQLGLKQGRLRGQ